MSETEGTTPAPEGATPSAGGVIHLVFEGQDVTLCGTSTMSGTEPTATPGLAGVWRCDACTTLVWLAELLEDDEPIPFGLAADPGAGL